MRKQFTWRGQSSLDFGLVLSGEDTHNAPERDVDTVEIPGRSGALTIDNGRWKDGTVPYKAFLHGDRLQERMEAVRCWLVGGAAGYSRLEDDYDPDCYRMARYAGGLDWDVDFAARTAEATLQFTCWPQRFLKSGEWPLTVENGAELRNPTGMTAQPVIELTLTGDAKLQAGDVQIAVAGYTGQMVLDCELQDAYKDGANLNRYVTAPEFPVLGAGVTKISWTGGISKCVVTPRWWTL